MNMSVDSSASINAYICFPSRFLSNVRWQELHISKQLKSGKYVCGRGADSRTTDDAHSLTRIVFEQWWRYELMALQIATVPRKRLRQKLRRQNSIAAYGQRCHWLQHNPKNTFARSRRDGACKRPPNKLSIFWWITAISSKRLGQ